MPKTTIKVLGKVSAILDHLAEAGTLSPSEIAEAIGEPRPSVYRLLDNLESLGLVEPGERRGSYQLGVRLFKLGMTVRHGFADLHAAADEALQAAHERTGQTLFLCVRDGYTCVCVERLDGIDVRVMIQPVGGTIPLHVGSTGRILLAYESREFQERYLGDGQLERLTRKTMVGRRALMRRCAEIRETGHEISDEDVIVGIASVGAPIRDIEGRVCAAISIAGPRPSILGDAYASQKRLILATAGEISRRLGYREPAER